MFAKVFALAIIAISLNAYQQQSNCNSFQPVCGVNHVTYQNACQCRKAQIKIERPGYCQRNFQIKWVKPKVCEDEYCAVTHHNSHNKKYRRRGQHGHHHRHQAQGNQNLMSQFSWQPSAMWGGANAGAASNWWQNQAFMGQNGLMNTYQAAAATNYQPMTPVANMGVTFQTHQVGAPIHQAAPMMNVAMNNNHNWVGSALGEVSDVMGASLSHEWNNQQDDAWTQVDLNDGQWDQVQLDGVEMSYNTQGTATVNQMGHWEGDKWVAAGAANQDSNQMAGGAQWNDNLDWQADASMGGAEWNTNMNWQADASMADASMTDSDLNADLSGADMNANMDWNLNLPQVDLSAMNNLTQLPTQTQMLGPDLSGINFDQLDSKTFNLLNNQWVKTHGRDAWWATAPSDESRITLVGDAI